MSGGKGIVLVTELKWRDAITFLRLISTSLGGMINESGKFQMNSDSIAKLVAESDVLSTHLVTKTTELTPEQFGDLPARDALEILHVSLSINLSPDILGKGLAVGKVISGAFASGPTTTA